MPDLSGNASLYRAGQHHFTGYMAVCQPDEVLRGTVSATPTFPTLTVSYTVSSGDYTAVLEDMLVRFFDSSGNPKGETRVAYGSVSSTSLPIGEMSAGTINIANGDTFRVYDTVYIKDKLVSATKQLLKDSRIAVGTNVTASPPVANTGGLWAGFVDDGETFATVPWFGSRSFPTDADNSSGLTYAWDEKDGSYDTGSSSSADPIMTFPQGFRNVSLVVTDADNSKTTRREIPVWVFDTDNPPYSAKASGRRWDRQRGYWAEMDFVVVGDVGMSDILDGAFVVYFEQEYYGSTQASYGSNITGRSHIKFCGYIRHETIEVTPEDDTLTFTVVSPMGMLNETPALSQLMVNRDSNNRWRFVSSLTVNRAFWYLIFWHATYMRYFDFLWNLTTTDFPYRRLAMTQKTIVDQLRSLAGSIEHLVTSDALGNMYIKQRENMIPTASRSGRTTTYNLTVADVKSAIINREFNGEIKAFVYGGITDGTTKSAQKPVFSKSPGNAPASFAVSAEEISDRIVDSQSDLNTKAGLAFAEANHLYNGAFVPKDAELILPSGYDFFEPANLEWLTFALAASTNKRGYSSSASRRWVINSVAVQYLEDGAKSVRLTIDHETAGPAGVTYKPPQPQQSQVPAVQPINITFPPYQPPQTGGTILPSGIVAEIALYERLSTAQEYTTNFDNSDFYGGPTWSTNGLSGLSGGIFSVTADPYSPLYLGTGTAVNVWAATTSGIYKVSDVFGTPSVSLQHTFASSLTSSEQRRTIMASRAAQGWCVCISYYDTGGTTCTYTTNGGATWTEVTITSHYRTTNGFPFSLRTPTVWVSQRTPGLVYAGAYTATAASVAATSALHRSTDYGATWEEIDGMTNGGTTGHCFHIPFADVNERYLYWTKWHAVSGGDAYELYRTDLTTGAQISINPVAASGNYAGSFTSNWSIDSSPLNPNLIAVAITRPSGAVQSVGLAVSQDAGLTWTTKVGLATSNRPLYPRFSGSNAGGLYIFGDGDFNAAYTNNIFDVVPVFETRIGNLSTTLLAGIIAGQNSSS